MKRHLKTRKQIAAILQDKFGIAAEIQVVPAKGEDRTLYLLENIRLDGRTTISGLRRVCKRICEALGAEPYGTTNIDLFSMGDGLSFDMMAEV